METSYFSIGWSCNPVIMYRNEQIEYFLRYKDDCSIKIFYNTINEERCLTGYIHNAKSGWLEFDVDMVDKNVLDLDNLGRRWEGEILNGQPFGFGHMYDENNIVVYEGFMINGKLECFGITFYPDTNTVEYKGMFINGNRHGKGDLYDKEGELIYAGYWSFGNPILSDLIVGNFENEELIHNLVNELRIGDDCYTTVQDIRLINYTNLQTIKIGDNSFKSATHFILNNCNELKSIQIGVNSFSCMKRCIDASKKDGQFAILNCSKLQEIVIRKFSFGDFGGSFKLNSKMSELYH